MARIAKETGLTRQTIYRIEGDPAGADKDAKRITGSDEQPGDGTGLVALEDIGELGQPLVVVNSLSLSGSTRQAARRRTA